MGNSIDSEAESVPEGHVYVSCAVCGERALLKHDYLTRDRYGRSVTIGELLTHESLESCGEWRCPRHPIPAKRYA